MALPTIKYFGRNTSDNNGLPNPAGFRYRLIVKLDRAVRSQDNNNKPLDVFLEFQRLTRDPQQFIRNVKAIAFDPNNADDQYFEIPDPNHPGQSLPDFPEKNLKIAVGQSQITTKPFWVKPDAKQEGVAITFPDYVLCTAYLGDFADDANVFSCHVLTIIEP